MLALLLAMSLGARAARVASEAPPAPRPALALPSLPGAAEFPGPAAIPELPAGPQLQAVAPAVQADAAVAAAAPRTSAAQAAWGLRALGRSLAKAAGASGPRAASSPLSSFFDRLDGGDEADEAPRAPREHDWFPRRLVPRRAPSAELPPPPPPRFKHPVLKRLAMAAPGIFVAANVFVGSQAIDATHRGWVLEAAALVLFAGIFSDLAARAAKLFRIPAHLEARIDAAASIVSFAAAPAYILYKTALQALPWVGLGAAVFFAAAGVYRVARGRPDERGLTVQAASATMVAMAAASGVLPPVAIAAMALATTLLAVAMLARARFPRYRKVTVPLVLILGALYGGFHAPLAHPGLWALAPMLGFGAYFAFWLLGVLRKAHE